MIDTNAKTVEHGLGAIVTELHQQSNTCSWPLIKLPPINLWNAPMLTDKEVRDRLKELPEIDLLEILEITSEEIVDRFDDKIEEKEEYFRADLEKDVNEGWEDE